MLGSMNHPHVEHLALAMRERGFDVAGGRATCAEPAAARSCPARACRRCSRRSQCAAARAARRAHVRWIRRLLRDWRPDIVHAHWLCGFACFAALAGAEPLVAMAWGSDVLRAERLKRLAEPGRAAPRGAGDGRLAGARGRDGRSRRPTAPEMLLMSWGVDLERFRPGGRRPRARCAPSSGCRRGG